MSKALKDLALLSLEGKRQKYPNVPTNAVPATKYTDKTANGLTKCILSLLQVEGCYATRIQSQGQYHEKLQSWTKGTTSKGTADIHATINGRHVSIEIKIGKDRQSEAQRATQAKIEAAGGLYFIARDFQSFYDYFQTIKKGGHHE